MILSSIFYARSSQTPLWLRYLPPHAGRYYQDSPEQTGLFGFNADRWREIALLSASGTNAWRYHTSRFSAYRSYEGSGRRTEDKRHSSGIYQ